MSSNPKSRIPASVHAYVRFSTDRQKDGDSIARQRASAQAEADKRGLKITEWISDEGKSAFKGANRKVGNLSKWLARLDAGEIAPGSILILESIDRLSREAVMDALDTYTRIINAGVTVITTMDGQECNRANLNAQWTGLIITLSKMAVANEESEKKSVRSKSVWKARRADPSAKRMVAFLPQWLETVDKPRPDRVALIHRMAHEVVELGYGTGKVARRLNQDGIPSWGAPRRDGRLPTWHNNSVLNILRGRSVLGEHQPMMDGPDGKPVVAGPIEPNYFHPVMKPAVWHKVQAALDKRSFKGSRGRKGNDYANLFSKLGQCHHCGSAHHRSSAGGQNVYLRCSAGVRGVCTNTKGVRYFEFEAKFLDLVLATKFQGGRVDDSQAVARLAEAEHARAALAVRMDSIAEQMIERADSPTLGRLLDKAEADARDLDQEIIDARKALEAIHSTPAQHESQAALAAELAKLDEPGADRFAIRSRLARAIADVTQSLTFDQDGVARIVLEDGVSTYEFDVKDGITHRSETLTKSGAMTKVEVREVTSLDEARAMKAALAA
ncbi:recombinase family protein [Brevundimonas vesicularis]|uniref:Recombinase family protein n=1 Tax=Brevundimonas vesicularis TaxID=41276 RepID=A0A1Z3U5T7_BREVE|nr:recombinase family protein [Brevundimonas vesicularis]ASE38646.1 recombinase family protein [Brevundimonas vesicularis]